MAKLEIPVVVDIDAVAELIEELKDLQTYKLSESDNMILVDRDDVVEIFVKHVKAKRREEREMGRWIYSKQGYTCSECKTQFPTEVHYLNPEYALPKYCPDCGARLEADT